MFDGLRKHLEMIRFSHTVFALPFALLAAVMSWSAVSANGKTAPFRWQHLLGILVCMVAARSAAMAFNRLADREIDRLNPRTAGRHLPSGQLTVRGVTLFTLWASLLFVGGTMLFWPNPLPLILSVPVLAFLLGYSFAKRFTSLAHFWLGCALMMAPVATWIALRGELVLADPRELLPISVLGLAVLLWVAGFDIIYACQDAEFDRQAKLKSVPAWLGVPSALRVSAFSHGLMVVALFALPEVARRVQIDLGFGWIYYLTVSFIGVLLLVEHRMVRPGDLRRVNVAFFNVNAIISFALFILGTVDLLCV